MAQISAKHLTAITWHFALDRPLNCHSLHFQCLFDFIGPENKTVAVIPCFPWCSENPKRETRVFQKVELINWNMSFINHPQCLWLNIGVQVVYENKTVTVIPSFPWCSENPKKETRVFQKVELINWNLSFINNPQCLRFNIGVQVVYDWRQMAKQKSSVLGIHTQIQLIINKVELQLCDVIIV